MIKEIKTSDGWELRYHNNVYMGAVEMGDDGYYNFWPSERKGYWSEGDLLAIYDYLHEKNKDWDESVQEFFR